ncbi:MAG: DUF2764 family protein [Candidatus Omnitrophica bacterium]|nr:DUF2764 family protein [Candidatus Omnitrophota bacterium]
MNNPYYYLISSLPMLDFDKEANLSYQEFFDLCKEQLSDSDFRILEKATLDYDDPTQENHVLNGWAKFNRRFRNEMIRIRAKNQSRDSSDYIRGDRYVDASSIEVINRALKAENPLEAEKMLDRFKWKRLSEFIKRDIFHVEALIIYSLHLQILERYKTINSSQGKERFEEYKQSKVLQLVSK